MSGGRFLYPDDGVEGTESAVELGSISMPFLPLQSNSCTNLDAGSSSVTAIARDWMSVQVRAHQIIIKSVLQTEGCCYVSALA